MTKSYPSKTSRGAFTIIELLVVVSIMMALMALMFPYLRGMVRSIQLSSAFNTVSSTGDQARTYATQLQIADADRAWPRVPGADFTGVAMVVSHTGEIRLTWNNQFAKRTGLPSPSFLETANFNGYCNLANLETQQFPSSIGAVGISRDAAASAVSAVSACVEKCWIC